MTDKLYNGFNNGRDKSDGVGGREVNHGTQETITKEQILDDEHWKWVVSVDMTSIHTKTFPEAYKTQALNAMSKWESQQLSAERESHKKEIERILSAVARGENLADSLNFDGKSELDKERERAGKLVEALKDAFDEFEDLNLHRQAARIHETLNEYDTATKES